MALIRIKDRSVFLTPQLQKGLWKALMQDYVTENGSIPQILDYITAREFERRVTIFLTHIYNSEKELFIKDWVYLSLDDQDAKFQITSLLIDWCSLRRGYKVTSELSKTEKEMLKVTHIDRIYPLGSTIELVSAPTPNYVKLIGWSPSFSVTIYCDEVQAINGEIDTELIIDLSMYTIKLNNKVEVVPLNPKRT